MSTLRLSLLIVILGTTISTLAWSDSHVVGPAPSVADWEVVRDGYAAAREGRCKDVMTILPAAADDETFTGFPEFVRKGTLEFIVNCAKDLGDRAAGIPYLYRLIDVAGTKAPFWLRVLVRSGIHTDQPDISVGALKRLLQYGIDEVRPLRFENLFFLYADLKRLDVGGDLRYEFLRMLYENGYTPINPFFVSDEFFVDYAIMSAERGHAASLKDIIHTLTDPGMILRVRIDRRFDTIRQDGSMEEFLDLNNAAEREIERLKGLLEEFPKLVLGHAMYSKALTAVWRFEEALEAIEPIALQVRAPGAESKFFDADSRKNWVLDVYSRALWRVEYDEQSEDMLIEATRMPEGPGLENVSQQLNYAGRLLDNGRLDEALAIVKELEDAKKSPISRMWVHNIIVCANAMGDSPKDYTHNLNFLIANERDNPTALIWAVLCTNDMQWAAEHLIRRLQSTDQRMKALLSLQYSVEDREDEERPRAHQTSKSLNPGHILHHRFNELRNRRDVRDAVNQVGRIEDIPLHPFAWRRP